MILILNIVEFAMLRILCLKNSYCLKDVHLYHTLIPPYFTHSCLRDLDKKKVVAGNTKETLS